MRALLTILIQSFLILSSYAQNSTVDEKRLVIGVLEEPPFVIKDVDGSFYGLSIDLWYHLAERLDLTYEFKEYNDQLSLLRALDYEEIDIAINPFTVNGPRLQLFRASQPFFISSIGIATAGSRFTRFKLFLGNIFTTNFIRLILVLLFMILTFGMIIWIIEKKRNPHQFKKLTDGFWWSVVTMTTVGYGDKAPKSFIGRTISVMWMFIAIILISSFTATIASTMTVNTLEAKLERFEDIEEIGKIGTLNFSNSKDLLIRKNLPIDMEFNDPLVGLNALTDGRIDVFVYDVRTMKYLIEENDMGSKIQMIPITVKRHSRSFLLPKESTLLDKIDPLLVDHISKSAWQKTLQKYHLEE